MVTQKAVKLYHYEFGRTIFIFILLLFVSFYVDLLRCHRPNLKQNPTLYFRVRHASFLSSSCSTNYFRTYAITDFLANRLVFLSTVTFVTRYEKIDHLQELLNSRYWLTKSGYGKFFFLSTFYSYRHRYQQSFLYRCTKF